jgi:uncharacterized protein DUF1326
MRTRVILVSLALIAVAFGVTLAAGAKGGGSSDWSMNASIIEACSCPMFCQCYFSAAPAGHGGHEGHAEEHFCKFNNAIKVNKGMYKGVNLAGAKFWVAGDLGGDFSQGQMDWAVVTFDPSVTKEQREGISEIVGHVYPVKWNSFTVAPDAPMIWESAKGDARAALDDGKTAEVILHSKVNSNAPGPVVIRNLKYWGAPRNDGFVLMPNEVEAYRVGDKPYEFKGTNGFMITFDINSKDVAGTKQN